jgi:hypothetical protein
MAGTTPAPPPKSLKTAGRALWRAQLGEFKANSPVELELLRQLCETIDELDVMKTELAALGYIVAGAAGQPRINPLVAAIAQHRKLADQLATALAIPLPSESVGRRRSAAAKQSADARWRGEKRRKGQLPSVQQKEQ